MKLFDTHCHIQDTKIISNAAALIERAIKAGVSKMICCGSSEEDWPLVQKLCTTFSELIPSFGLHPWHAGGRSDKWHETLEQYLATFPQAVVGEIGLDHALEMRNDDVQFDVFKTQLQIAIKFNRPASIHCRKAWESLFKAFHETGPLRRNFAIHSYSGQHELIAKLEEIGAFFSFSGSVTRSGNKRARKSAAAVHLNRLLIETDAPDLAPVIDGQLISINEPANLPYILNELAEIRQLPPSTLADRLWENSCRLFL